ncbi:hypothetical protein KKD52_05160 [Myxococcota bacterium]|nr:hypothetical protein [Myxococcota bacterium]MBU1411155.1 hypothetical protein [Myxococcota bacterium]MBU1509729.1 hypothetical protein [Myxococcota bacterium]PKN25669.1 MAG: hypothetical protein CVU65_08080 [Deltaproteobacteria bacterium HGW-Deltaproteobacteria-22]
MIEATEVTQDTVENEPRPSAEAPAWRWAARLGVALAFSLVVGALPVFVHREIRELATLRAELKEIQGLNDTMYGRLEDSVARLRALKTPEGAARIMREKGFLPPGARVYQLEIMDQTTARSRDRMER